MGTEAKTNNYWIAPNAISISLNALGNENRIQGSVTSGSVISCYIESVKPESAGEAYAGNGDGLGLDNGRNPKRWTLTISPTYFNSDAPKYVYVAIPRSASFGTQAIVVFPSEQIDIYGKNEDDEQIGSADYFYIWLRGIISAPVERDGTLQREWTQQIAWGSLGTYEDIMDMSETDWYSYSGANGGSVTFLKKIIMKAGSFFQNIFLGDQDHELTGVATAATEDEYIDSDTLVATPNFIGQHYMRKDADDEAAGLIGFIKGLWIKTSGLFGFSEDGDVVARTLTAKGSSSGTVTDIDNATRKNLGLEVAESGIIGGVLRVAKSILTKTIQSINFTGSADSLFGTGWQLTDNDGNGNSRLVVDNLFVRAKAVFNELEVRKFVAMAGNYVFSPAASIIEEVDYIHYTTDPDTGETGEEVLGYTYVKVPWVLRLVPLSLVGKILSKKKMVRSTMSASDWQNVDAFRCWLKSDDGTTQTINTWKDGMLARCQTFNLESGNEATHTGTWNGETGANARNVSNKLYWRAVTNAKSGRNSDNYTLPNHVLEDGLSHSYIDLSNATQLCLANSDRPEPLDHIVCYGDYKDRSLSNIISIETVGSEAPCIRELLDVGYSSNPQVLIDWSLDGKERTRISPVAGNKFVAPEFIVETTGEHLRNENIKGTALGFVSQSLILDTGSVGDIWLVEYSAWPGKIRVCTSAQMENPITGQIVNATYEERTVARGDGYLIESPSSITGNGHLFVATEGGWMDKGLVNEVKSSLKVDINGIVGRVSDAEGNITQLQQTAASLITLVSRDSKSRNILSGVLTGDGWKSGVWDDDSFAQSGSVSVDENGWFKKNAQADNCFALGGIALDEGEYMLSLCSDAVSSTGTASVDYPSVTCYLKKSSNTVTITTDSGAERRESTSSIEITEAQSGTYTLYVVSSKIRFPQLEVGSAATEFDATIEEAVSCILQTADNISLSITNKLGETGININGNNRSIELRGDNVTFQNSAGTLTTPKIRIDPTTGTLHAEDGDFGGVVNAKGFTTKFRDIRNLNNGGRVYYAVYGDNGIWNFMAGSGALDFVILPTNSYCYPGQRVTVYCPFISIGDGEKVAIVTGDWEEEEGMTDFFPRPFRGVGLPINTSGSGPYEPVLINSYTPVYEIDISDGLIELMCIPTTDTQDPNHLCDWCVVNVGTNLCTLKDSNHMNW